MDSTPDTVRIWMAATFDKMNRCERLNLELTDGTRALYLHFDDVFTCLLCPECHEVQRFQHFRDVEVKDTCPPPLQCVMVFNRLVDRCISVSDTKATTCAAATSHSFST